MEPLKIKPDPTCKACHGDGVVYDSVPYGMGSTSLESFCDCVLEQIPEGEEDREVEIELPENDRQDKRSSEAFDNWNAGERPAHWL